MLDRRPARVTGRQAPPLHLRRGSGSGAIFQRATHKFCGRGGLRYELANFVNMIRAKKTQTYQLSFDETRWIAKVLEQSQKNIHVIK